MSRKTTEFAMTDAEMGALSDEHLVVLKRLEAGLSYEEIAEGLGRPIGTVKSRINRARAALAKLRAPAEQAEAA